MSKRYISTMRCPQCCQPLTKEDITWLSNHEEDICNSDNLYKCVSCGCLWMIEEVDDINPIG